MTTHWPLLGLAALALLSQTSWGLPSLPWQQAEEVSGRALKRVARDTSCMGLPPSLCKRDPTPSPEVVSPCDGFIDVVFVVESSGINNLSPKSGYRWDAYRTLMKRFISSFNIGSSNKAQFGAVTFGSDVRKVFGLSQYGSSSSLEQAVDSMTLGSSNLRYTKLASALDAVGRYLFTTGARSGATRLVVLFTDGEFGEDEGSIVRASNALQADTGASVMSVLVDGYSATTLQNTVSAPENLFKTNNGFNRVIQAATKRACDIAQLKLTPDASASQCSSKADIVFYLDAVFDEQNDEEKRTYAEQVNFAFSLAKQITKNKNARIGLAMSTYRTQMVFALRAFSDSQSVYTAFKAIKNPTVPSTWDSRKVFGMIRREMFTSCDAQRADAARIVIYLGGDGRYVHLYKDEVNRLTSSGARVIGIGSGLDSEYRMNNAFTDAFSSSIYNLVTIEKDLFTRVCKLSSSPPTVRLPSSPICGIRYNPKIDVIFLVEAAPKTYSGVYLEFGDTASRIISYFSLGSSAVQVGLVVYGAGEPFIYDLTETSDAETRARVLHSHLYQRSQAVDKTSRYYGLDDTLDFITLKLYRTSFGARPGAKRIIVHIGQSNARYSYNSKYQEVEAKARNLESTLGATIVSYEVGRFSNYPKLTASDSNLFTVDSEGDLDKQFLPVMKRVLEIPTLSSTPNPAPLINGECNPVDLLYVFDYSGSMKTETQSMLDASHGILLGNQPIGKSGIQVAVEYFANNYVTTLFGFDKYSNIKDLSRALKDFLGGTVRKGDSRYGISHSIQTMSSGAGARSQAAKAVVLMSDGNEDYSTDHGEALRQAGIHVITITFSTTGTRIAETLREIASTPDYAFSERNGLLNYGDISNLICSLNGPFRQQVRPQTTRAPPNPGLPSGATCNPFSDILFVLDSSGSVGSDWKTELEFVVSIIQHFVIGLDDTLFATVSFSEDASTIFDFDDFLDQRSIANKLRSAYHKDDSTQTDKGLEMAYDLFSQKSRGARHDAQKVLILIIDGKTDLSSASPAMRAAEQLKGMGVQLITVGVADAADYELKKLASPGQEPFRVNKFYELESIKSQLLSRICGDSIAPGLKPTPAVHSNPDSCAPFVDIVFAIDSSGSVGSNWDSELKFATAIAQRFTLGPDDVQIAAVTFSSYAETAFHLGRYTDQASLAQGFLSVKNIRRSTATDTGFDKIRTDVLQKSSGARPDAVKLVILITDGESNDVQLTRAAAKKLKDNGVTIIAIGIGHEVNKSELEAVATSSSKDVVMATDFSALSGLDDRVYKMTCADVM